MIQALTFQVNGCTVPVYLTGIPRILDHRSDSEDCLRIKAIDILTVYNLMPSPRLDEWDYEESIRLTMCEVFPSDCLSRIERYSSGSSGLYLPWRSFFAVESDISESPKILEDLDQIRIDECIRRYWWALLAVGREKGMKIHRKGEDGTVTTEQHMPYVSTRSLNDAVQRRLLEKSFEKPFGFGISCREVKRSPSVYLPESKLADAISKYCRYRISDRAVRQILVKAEFLAPTGKGRGTRYELTPTGKGFASDSPRHWHHSVITYLDGLGYL